MTTNTTPSRADALQAKPPGIDALQCVIASLRDTAHFADEEGELTNDLRALRDWAFARAALSAAQDAPAVSAGDALPTVHRTAPERIYLCIGDEADQRDAPFDELTDITWSHDQPVDVAVPYVRADLAPAQAAQAVPQGWPRAAKDQRDQGWTLDYRFLERVTDLAAPRTEYSTSMEATEQVLIAALEVLAAAPAAPQSAAQQWDARVTLPGDIERMAVNRYRPVPSGVLAYKVVGGDGDRILFFGTKGECQSVARELTEAFLDGAHVALAAQAQEAAPAPPSAAERSQE